MSYITMVYLFKLRSQHGYITINKISDFIFISSISLIISFENDWVQSSISHCIQQIMQLSVIPGRRTDLLLASMLQSSVKLPFTGVQVFFFIINLQIIHVLCALCPTLCNPMDCSPPGFSVHGMFQARILELVDISFSRGSS